jgi:hypothetical protein
MNEPELKRWVSELDNTSVRYEAIWGVGKLAEYADESLRQKWDRQWARLNEALGGSDYDLAIDLAQGCIRAWAALESAAIAKGHKPIAPDCIEIAHPETGNVYRLCKTLDDTQHVKQGVATYSLDEVVRILEANTLVNKVAAQAAPPKETQRFAFDWKHGDDVPW